MSVIVYYLHNEKISAHEYSIQDVVHNTHDAQEYIMLSMQPNKEFNKEFASSALWVI